MIELNGHIFYRIPCRRSDSIGPFLISNLRLNRLRRRRRQIKQRIKYRSTSFVHLNVHFLTNLSTIFYCKFSIWLTHNLSEQFVGIAARMISVASNQLQFYSSFWISVCECLYTFDHCCYGFIDAIAIQMSQCYCAWACSIDEKKRIKLICLLNANWRRCVCVCVRVSLTIDDSPECRTTTIMHVVASSDPMMFTFLSCVATAAISLCPTYNNPTGPTCRSKSSNRQQTNEFNVSIEKIFEKKKLPFSFVLKAIDLRNLCKRDVAWIMTPCP